VGCHIVLLELPKSVGLHNGHEWVQVISQDSYVRLTCQRYLDVSRVPYHSKLHMSHSITEPPPGWVVLADCTTQRFKPRLSPIKSDVSIPVHVHPLDTINWKWDSSDQATCLRKGCIFVTLNDSLQSSTPTLMFYRIPNIHCTREMVGDLTLENPQRIATSEMLCPISRAPPITPSSLT
jgi:hypothetical protein